MNALLQELSIKNSALYNAYEETYKEVKLLLDKFSVNFPTYTDHSVTHTEEVLNLAGQLLTESEIHTLNDDELYILSTACILHDIGMCIPPSRIEELCEHDEYLAYVDKYKDSSLEVYLRDIHHELSHNFILKEYRALKIPSEKYAKAIALIAKAHRKVELQNFDEFDPRYFAKSGRQTVCLPYLGAIIRIADELDVTNMRTPSLLLKYYLPDNEVSIREFKKHQSLIQINFRDDSVIIEAVCTDHNILAAVEEQFQKIQDVISNCQKVIRTISNIDNRNLTLRVSKLEPRFVYKDFDPKGIKYSFDIKNVITAFVGKDLYGDYKAALREGIQNAIDACNYRKSIDQNYVPFLQVSVNNDEIKISDNGNGMDEFIIENYFGKLASSFYEQSKVKSAFEAIGQFGIGVFSYFLIADYIEIETRNQHGKSLKFRTDQDPSGYFHFFEGYHKDNLGTTLILHLKPEFKGQITYNEMEDFIKKNFAYINLDIELSDHKSLEIIKPASFELKFESDFLPRMYHSAYEFRYQLSILRFAHSDNNVEGEMAIVVPSRKNNYPRLQYIFNSENFFGRTHNVMSEIKISQKGVYVTNYANALGYLVGNINIKTKLNINLSREEFRNEADLIPLVSIFETGLIELVFTKYLTSIKVTAKEDIFKFSKWFLKNVLPNAWKLNEEATAALRKYIIIEIKYDGKTLYSSIDQIKALGTNIVILQNNQVFHDRLKNFIVVSEGEYELNYTHLLQTNLKYGLTFDKFDGEEYYVLNQDFYENNRVVGKLLAELSIYKSLIFTNSEKVFVRRKLASEDEAYFSSRFNSNSTFCKFIIDNINAFKENSTNLKILKEVISNIEEVGYPSFKDTTTSVVKKSNLLLQKLELSPSITRFILKKMHL